MSKGTCISVSCLAVFMVERSIAQAHSLSFGCAILCRSESFSPRCVHALRTASLRCGRWKAARADRSLRQLHRAQVEGVRLPTHRVLDTHDGREEQSDRLHLGLGKLRG